MVIMGLNNGSTVKDLDEAAERLKKGGIVCVVKDKGVLKAYPHARKVHFQNVFGEENVFTVEGRA